MKEPGPEGPRQASPTDYKRGEKEYQSLAVWWWHSSLIPALRGQRQADICEFQASLVYKLSSRTTRATQRNPASKNKHKNRMSVIEDKIGEMDTLVKEIVKF